MKIAIIGYGKMGKEIYSLAQKRGIGALRIDPNAPEAEFPSITDESLRGVDVAIDATTPAVVVKNIGQVADRGINVVVSTTGWYDRMDEVSDIVEKRGIGLIWSGNFSIGVNMFFRIVEHAASLADAIEGYDISLHEFHHAQKADSPSGTAQMIGKIILKQMSRKDTLLTEAPNRPIKPNELHVSSTRCGSIPGTHIVTIDSPADTIELKHTARNREGFALGALLAAQFILGKKGLYGIDDLMNAVVGA